MTSLHSYTVMAAMSGSKATVLIIVAAIGIIILVFRIKYAPPWWLRRHRDTNARREQRDQAPHPRGQRSGNDHDHDDAG